MFLSLKLNLKKLIGPGGIIRHGHCLSSATRLHFASVENGQQFPTSNMEI